MISSKIEVLSKRDMERVHEASLEILSKKGVIFQSDSAVSLFKKAGQRVDGQTVFMDRALVEQSLKQCPSTFRLHAPNPQNDLTIGEGLVVHPAGGEIFISDSEKGRRAPTMEDFADMQKIYQACNHIGIGGFQPLSPGGLENRYKCMHLTYESFKHCDKPLLAPMELNSVAEKEENLGMYEIVFGKDFLKEHYVTWHAVCPNSPLFYSAFACEGIEVYAKWNQPVCLVSAPMSGITSPVFLFSTVVLANAEVLAGLVLAQLIRPGVPVIPSASLTYGNMKMASWECACPDTALMLVAGTQMYKDYYHLPARSQTGVTSSKAIDYQAGMETLQSFILTALAGVTLTSQSAGTLENLLVTSLEKTVLDDELIARVFRILEGFDVSDEALDLDDIMETDFRGDFMLCDNTVEHCHDGWQPLLSNWNNYETWEKQGKPDLIQEAHKKARRILDEAPDTLLDRELDKDLKSYMSKIENS